MKTSVRILASVLIAAMLAACTACTGGTGKTEQTGTSRNDTAHSLGGATVKMAFPYEVSTTPGQSEATDAFIARVKAAEKTYNCKIEYVCKAQSEYYDSLLTNCMAGTPTGDIINVGSAYLYQYAQKGVLEPLNDYAAYKEYLGNQISKLTAGWMAYRGKVYSMCLEPLEQRTMIGFNKRILQENNLAEPYALAKAGKWTWDVFADYCKKCTKTSASGQIQQYGFHGDLTYVIASAIASNNGQIIRNDNDQFKVALDETNTMEAINQVEKWMHVDKFMNTENVYWDGPMRMFEKGKAAFILCPGIWVPLERFNQTMTDDDYGFVYFPKGPKANGYTELFSGWESIAIPTATKLDKDTLIRLYVETKLPVDFDVKKDLENQFRISYEPCLRDEGSMDVLLDLQKNNRFTFIQYANFDLEAPEDTSISLKEFSAALGAGEKTPAQLVGAIKSPIQKYLDDHYNK